MSVTPTQHVQVDDRLLKSEDHGLSATYKGKSRGVQCNLEGNRDQSLLVRRLLGRTEVDNPIGNQRCCTDPTSCLQPSWEKQEDIAQEDDVKSLELQKKMPTWTDYVPDHTRATHLPKLTTQN